MADATDLLAVEALWSATSAYPIEVIRIDPTGTIVGAPVVAGVGVFYPYLARYGSDLLVEWNTTSHLQLAVVTPP